MIPLWEIWLLQQQCPGSANKKTTEQTNSYKSIVYPMLAMIYVPKPLSSQYLFIKEMPLSSLICKCPTNYPLSSVNTFHTARYSFSDLYMRITKSLQARSAIRLRTGCWDSGQHTKMNRYTNFFYYYLQPLSMVMQWSDVNALVRLSRNASVKISLERLFPFSTSAGSKVFTLLCFWRLGFCICFCYFHV